MHDQSIVFVDEERRVVLPIGSIQISKTSFPDSCLSVQWLSSILSVSIWGEEGLRRGPLAQQVQEFVGPSDLVIITERVDDGALLIGPMVKMGLVEVLDRQIPRHWPQRAGT